MFPKERFTWLPEENCYRCPAHRARMGTEEAKAILRLGKQTVEMGYADLKGNRHLREFSGRGLARVRTEAGMNELPRNLIILETMLARRQNYPETTKNAVNNTS
jgi:hypothetical protein